MQTSQKHQFGRKGIRVLVVEDDLCTRILWEWAVYRAIDRPEVEWADSAEAALVVLGEQSCSPAFDIVICDVHLRGLLSGVDLSRLAREMVGTFVLSSASKIEDLKANFPNFPTDLVFLEKGMGMDGIIRQLQMIGAKASGVEFKVRTLGD